MKTGVMALILLVAMAFSNNAKAGIECQIVSHEEVPGSANKSTADYDIKFKVFTNIYGEPGREVTPILKGNVQPNETWIFHEIISYDKEANIAIARMRGWPSGSWFEFSTGWRYSDDDLIFWSDPVCYVYPPDAEPEEQRYRLKLGEKYIPTPGDLAAPMIVFPFLTRDKKLPSKVISITETSYRGPVGNYSIKFSIESLPSGMVFFAGQSYPKGPWTIWPANNSGDGTYTAMISEWPRGSFFPFSFGTISGGKETWADPAGSPYAHEDHFGETLGEAETCFINETGDELVLKIKDLGSNIYRLYLNFPTDNGYWHLFVKGQEYYDGPWIGWPTEENYPCSYVDIFWPYNGPFHFSFGVFGRDYEYHWIDPAGSQFMCEDHLCIDFGATQIN